MKITYKRLIDVDFLLKNVFLKEIDITNPTKNKLTWAIFSLQKEVKELMDIYNKKMSKIFIDKASVDGDENIMFHDVHKNIMKFTKAAENERNIEHDKLLLEQIDINGYIYKNNEMFLKKFGYTIDVMNGILVNIDDLQEPEADFEEEKKDKA